MTLFQNKKLFLNTVNHRLNLRWFCVCLYKTKTLLIEFNLTKAFFYDSVYFVKLLIFENREKPAPIKFVILCLLRLSVNSHMICIDQSAITAIYLLSVRCKLYFST